MGDRGNMFSFFRVIHVRIETRINISISHDHQFGKHGHLEKLISKRLIKQELLMPSWQGHMIN